MREQYWQDTLEIAVGIIQSMQYKSSENIFF